jgi:hypothetical protein
MQSRVFIKRVFSLELSEEELGIVAGALYCANSEDIKCFVDKYKYPCSGYSFDEVAELQEKLSEEVNKLIESKKK